MFSRPYTTLSRITIEAADCKMNYQHLNGHLTIFIEPLDPVLPMGNRDPLLGQRTTNTTRTQDTITRQRHDPQNNPQPSTSCAHHNPMLADSTHRSPQIPSETVEPLQLQPSDIPSSQNLSPVPTTYDERNYPQEEDSDTNSENDNEQQNSQQNIAPIPIADPIHMSKQENEMPPQEDIPQNENENERPHTPDPDNPIQDNTEFANPNFSLDEIPEEQQNDQSQPSTSNSNINSTLANFMDSPNFQDIMKKMTLQVGESTFDRIARNPRLVKQWILQVIHKFPGLLDDLTDDTVEIVDTKNGPIRILQPTTSQNPQPLDQQDHETSQVREVAPCPPLTIQQQQENNDASTIPSSTSPPALTSSEESDSDCVIEKVSPCPKKKPFKRPAPPPEVSSPQVILKKIPHKQGSGSYTVTTTLDTNGQTSTNNTGLDNKTQKRPRLHDQTQQPSTSTGTVTQQNHKDKKHRKHKKDKKKDKDKDN